MYAKIIPMVQSRAATGAPMRIPGNAFTLALVIAANGLFTSFSAQASTTSSLYTQVEGVSEYRLSNGLRVLLAPDAS